MSTLELILNKYKLDPSSKSPIEISKIGKENLSLLFNELGFKSGAEIGVYEGEYSEHLCRSNPDAKIYGVDSFVPYNGYNDYKLKKTINAYHEKAKKISDTYKNYVLIEKFSMDAVHEFKDKSLDFVYIDANHQDPFITDDIKYWSRKVRSGGIISGHDYVELRHKGHPEYDVKKAVKKFVKDNNIKIWFTTSLEDAAINKHDWSRSWIIVKP